VKRAALGGLGSAFRVGSIGVGGEGGRLARVITIARWTMAETKNPWR
jgi:hypothetical protein